MRKMRVQAVLLVATLWTGDLLAAPELRIKAAPGGEFATGTIDVAVPIGDNHVDLEIAVYEDGVESAELEAQAVWRVECRKPRACLPEVAAIESGRGRDLTLPDAEFPPFRVIVSIPGSDVSATFRVARARMAAAEPAAPAPEKHRRSRPADAPPAAESPGDTPAAPHSPASSAPRGRGARGGWGGGHRNRGAQNADASSSSAPTGGAASFGGAYGSDEPAAASAPLHSKKGVGVSQIDAGFDTYYSSLPDFGGGVSRGPVTGQRGYNRDNVVPVISCSYAPDAKGVVRLQCSDPDKKSASKSAPKKTAAKKVPEIKAPAKRLVAKKSAKPTKIVAANTRK